MQHVRVLILAMMLAGCRGTEPAKIVIDCAKAEADKIAVLLTSMRSLLTGQPDWAGIEARAIDAGEAIGGCALAELVQEYLAPTPPAAPGTARMASTEARTARATFEDFRARVAGGATYRTKHGDL